MYTDVNRKDACIPREQGSEMKEVMVRIRIEALLVTREVYAVACIDPTIKCLS